jgi:hypothetical protein
MAERLLLRSCTVPCVLFASVGSGSCGTDTVPASPQTPTDKSACWREAVEDRTQRQLHHSRLRVLAWRMVTDPG